MRKILVVVPDMNLGGVTSSVINFCNELDKKGNIVHFLNMGKENPEAENKIHRNIIRLHLVGIASKWQLGIDDFKNISALKKAKLIPMAIIKKLTNHTEKWMNIVFHDHCIENEYDVAVAFRQCAPCYYFVLNCISAKKKIAFIHGNCKDLGDISSFDHYFSQYDYIACVSKACCEGFKKQYQKIKDKFTYVYNMFSVDEIKKNAKTKCPVQMSDDVFNIITISRIENATKGIDRIPIICKNLKDKNMKFHWYIVGDGPDLKYDEDLSKQFNTEDVLSYCGAMSNPHSMVRCADLSVLPTLGEAYSMTIIESLIVGIPIVVTCYEGVEEAVKDGITGLIAHQSVEDMTNKVSSLLLNSNLLDQMKNNCLNYKFTNDIAYNQFKALL